MSKRRHVIDRTIRMARKRIVSGIKEDLSRGRYRKHQPPTREKQRLIADAQRQARRWKMARKLGASRAYCARYARRRDQLQYDYTVLSIDALKKAGQW